MSKKSYVVGSINKSKNDNKYVQLFLPPETRDLLVQQVKLNDGKLNLMLEKKDDAIESLIKAYQEKKVSEDVYEKRLKSLESIPDYVLANLKMIVESD